MSTFFSGTDTSTLLQEGQDRNNIVSLIVNNDGTYSAAITRHVHTAAVVHENGTYQLFGDGEQAYEDEYETEDEYIEYFMFDITRKEPNKLFSFIDRLGSIMTKKRTVTTATQPISGIGSASSYSDLWAYDEPLPTKSATQQAKPKAATPVKVAFPVPAKKAANPLKVAAKDSFDEYIEGLALQLVTGDIFASLNHSINLQVYCKEVMADKCRKRFGSDLSTKGLFALWLDNMVDLLVWSADHPELEGYRPNDKGEIVAQELVNLLEAIPTKNVYLNEIITSLKSYL